MLFIQSCYISSLEPHLGNEPEAMGNLADRKEEVKALSRSSCWARNTEADLGVRRGVKTELTR